MTPFTCAIDQNMKLTLDNSILEGDENLKSSEFSLEIEYHGEKPDNYHWSIKNNKKISLDTPIVLHLDTKPCLYKEYKHKNTEKLHWPIKKS